MRRRRSTAIADDATQGLAAAVGGLVEDRLLCSEVAWAQGLLRLRGRKGTRGPTNGVCAGHFLRRISGSGGSFVAPQRKLGRRNEERRPAFPAPRGEGRVGVER